MKPQWRIGELAARHNMNPRTLRYYEALGLLLPPARSPRGYRLYTEADRERLTFIGKAKAIGLTLREVREILVLREAGKQPCTHVVALLDQKLVAVDAQVAALLALRQKLSALRSNAATSQNTGACVCGIIEDGGALHAHRAVLEKRTSRRSPAIF